MASSSILGILQNAAAAFGIPAPLFTAQAQQESSLNPNAYNAKSGATGLLQLEPATAAQYGVTGSALLDPAANATAGANYLSDLFNQFGDWATALAAYDWGPGNVAAAQQKYGANWLAYAPAETQNYVAGILGSSATPTSTPASPIASAAVIPDASNIDIPDYSDLVSDVTGATGPAAAGGPNFFLLALLGLGVYLAADFLFGELA
jgi:soluble lytic murein transglycosylase-like protein